MNKPDLPIETLIEQLHAEDWLARCDAARLLGQSGDPCAVDALLPDLLDSDWRVRRNAAQALGALRDPRAVESLLNALKDRTMTVRQRAIVALGRIKNIQALPALLDVLLANKHESYDAAKAIRKFGKKALPEIAKAYRESNNPQLLMLLIEMKYEGALDLLLNLLKNPEPPARLTAIRELGKLGNKKAIPYLIDQLSNSDPMLQSEVVRAVGKLGAIEVVPSLLDLLLGDELYGPRSNIYHAVTEALQAFGGIGDEIKDAFPGSYPAILNMGGAPISLPEALGLFGNDPAHRLNEALSRLQTGALEPTDIPGLPSEIVNKVLENMSWRFGVMFADARDARQEHVTRLVELLKSESSLVRAAAVLTLPWYTDERAIAPLERAARDADEMVRKAAAWALQALQKALFYRKQLGL